MTDFFGGAGAHIIDLVFFKGTLVILIAASVCMLLRRHAASLRHLVWGASFVVLLALPAMNLLAPESGTSLIELSPVESVQERGQDAAPVAAFAPTTVAPSEAPQQAASARVLPQVEQVSSQPWIVLIWLVGCGVVLARLGLSLRSANRLAKGATPASDALQARTAALARRMGMRRFPTVVTHPQIRIPVVLGFLRPTILLPDGFSSWPEQRVDAALSHELTHVQRGDYAVHIVAGTAQALFWANPLVWLAGKRLDVERERACDDRLVETAFDPIDYAEHLVSLARQLRTPVAGMALSLAGRSSLAERVRGILDSGQRRTPAGRAALLSVVLIAVATVALNGAFRFVGPAPQPDPLREALNDQNPETRRYAAWAMGESENPEYVGDLIGRLGDADARVRGVVAWALGEIKDPDSVDDLAARLRDGDPLVREMLVLAIGEIEDRSGRAAVAGADAPSSAKNWALAQIDDTDAPEVFAGELTGEEPAAGSLQTHVGRLGSARATDRARAAEALGRLGQEEAVEALLDRLQDPDASVRAAAIWALDEINPFRESGGTTS